MTDRTHILGKNSDTNNATNYRSFAELGEDNHILIHVSPTARENLAPWRQYMHDLDDFFTRLYKYHQKSGFNCLVCGQLLELVQIVYSVLLPIFFLNYIDYDILFKNTPTPTNNPTSKVHIYDVVKPFNSVTIPSIQLFAIFLALVFLVWKTVKTVHSIIVNLAIRQFYKDVLHISDCTSLTWQDVQSKIISSRHIFLAQDSHLTELDIHNRILRHSNFMIALINRGVLPIYYKVPLVGEVTFFTQSFLYNCQLLFFRGPFKCIFEESWLISEDTKNANYRQAVAKKLDRSIVILASINLFLSPVLCIWQILYFFYSNAASVKRDPVVLGLRNWSLYARWFCRHFNELDHQLNERLNHAYKPAKKYMDAFISRLLETFAEFVRRTTGATLAILLLLTIYDENVIQVVHLLTLITGLWLIWSIACGLTPPDIPPRFSKTELYDQILQNIHYVPHNYPPFTPQARSAMADLFQYKIIKLLEDLLSTLATPYIMIRHLRSRSIEIVDFFRNYTIEVPGTGDVCVFSMMNIRENGNPQWQPLSLSIHRSQGEEGGDTDGRRTSQISPRLKPQTMQDTPRVREDASYGLDEAVESYHESSLSQSVNIPQFQRETLTSPALPLQTEHGKLELSLIHFKLQNPSWNPYNDVQREFIQQVTSQAIEQASNRQTSYHLTNRSEDDIGVQGRSNGGSLFQRPRSPQRMSDIDSSTAISLSTLFLHEHARMPMSSNFPSTSSSSQHVPSKLKSETDPLL